MLAHKTHSDSGSLLWSPARDKMAYVTAHGLQVYLSDPNTSSETHLLLSDEPFSELSWSADSCYLAGRDPDGIWQIWRCDGSRAQLVYRVAASSLDWFGEHQVVYVPDAGGLVLVDLRDTSHERPLLG